MIKAIIIKNGNSKLLNVWHIDESKPKCYLVGTSYKFNSKLLKQIKLPL